MTSLAIIGFGSNIGDRVSYLWEAITMFGEFTNVSSIWETEPWGIRDQPWFLNMVVEFVWENNSNDPNTPFNLLDRCLEIERKLGRFRGQTKNGPRVIDCDLLACRLDHIEQIISHPRLKLPHHGIANRRSVLVPWAEINPGYIIRGRTIGEHEKMACALKGQAVHPYTPTP